MINYENLEPARDQPVFKGVGRNRKKTDFKVTFKPFKTICTEYPRSDSSRWNNNIFKNIFHFYY
jgi:hypothetical protein